MAEQERENNDMIEVIVAWTYEGRDGTERALEALIPSPAGAERILLWYREGDPNAEGYDVIARQYARSGRVKATKRRFLAEEENLEVVDGRH